jgi:hypothetical protein
MTGSMTRLAEVSRRRRSLEPDDVQLVGLHGQVDVAQNPLQIAVFQPATFELALPLLRLDADEHASVSVLLAKSGGPY